MENISAILSSGGGSQPTLGEPPAPKISEAIPVSFPRAPAPPPVSHTNIQKSKESEEIERELMARSSAAPPSVPEQIQTADVATLPLDQLISMIHGMKDQLDAMLRVIKGQQVEASKAIFSDATLLETGERIVEGVFDGQHMVGQDGKEYPVPPNYASKSKLVEGDLLKLTITNSGKFLFKQIGPAARKRTKGELLCEENGQWIALEGNRRYKILKASVTFYKGKPGDDVIFLVPEDGHGTWGAVENIVHV